MRDHIDQRSEELDRVDSILICRAIGEKLRQNLGPERSPLPHHLQLLMDRLQDQESQDQNLHDQDRNGAPG